MILEVALLLSGCLSGAEPPRFAASEIEPGGDLGGHRTADLDGDGRGDLLLVAWTEESGRELRIHLQRPDGILPPAPDRTVPVKADIVGFAVADVREDPGSELLLFTGSACFGYSTTRSGYAGNAAKLFDWPLICGVPQRKDLLRLDTVRDLDGTGGVEILAPGFDGWAVFARDGDGGFARRASFPFESRRPETVERRQVDLRFGPDDRRDRRARAAGSARRAQRDWRGEADEPDLPALVEAWTGSDASGSGALIETKAWIPAPSVVDEDGDGLADLVFVSPSGDDAEVSVFRQRSGGVFPPAPDWKGTLPRAGSVRILDLDGDRRPDVLTVHGESADSFQVRIFLGRGGGFPTEPDQILKISGYGVQATAADLDGDGAAELVVTHYSLSELAALKAAVHRTVLVYRRDAERAFARSPASKLDERFSAAEAKALSQPIIFDADLLGAGRRQALHADRDGALVAREFDSSLGLRTEPCFRFVPRRMILGIDPADLSRDGRTDLVLRHHRSLTVLVSR